MKEKLFCCAKFRPKLFWSFIGRLHITITTHHLMTGIECLQNHWRNLFIQLMSCPLCKAKPCQWIFNLLPLLVMPSHCKTRDMIGTKNSLLWSWTRASMGTWNSPAVNLTQASDLCRTWRPTELANLTHFSNRYPQVWLLPHAFFYGLPL